MDPNNWDLQAVVRGCNLTCQTVAATVDPISSFPPPQFWDQQLHLPGQEEEEEILMIFPDLSTTTTQTALHELEDLCKPFILHHPLPQQQQPNDPVETQVPQQPKQPHQPQSQISKSKRRKNQQKKVVCEVPADGAPPDLWAWRKYGQKPIKGSPYPRGYYRCSSSKGCLARKQVERSRTNPGMLVITYTAEHNHPIPTHRSSLSGSTRHKVVPPLPSSGQPLAVSGGNPSSSSLSPSAGLSPTTPLKFTMEDEPLRQGKDEEGEAEEEDEGDEDLLAMMGEDEMLFMDLEESIGPTTNAAVITEVDLSAASALGGGFEEHFLPSPWWTSNNTATAAGGS